MRKAQLMQRLFLLVRYAELDVSEPIISFMTKADLVAFLDTFLRKFIHYLTYVIPPNKCINS